MRQCCRLQACWVQLCLVSCLAWVLIIALSLGAHAPAICIPCMLCAVHSPCSPSVDCCHLLEKQGWPPEDSFEIYVGSSPSWGKNVFISLLDVLGFQSKRSFALFHLGKYLAGSVAEQMTDLFSTEEEYLRKSWTMFLCNCDPKTKWQNKTELKSFCYLAFCWGGKNPAAKFYNCTLESLSNSRALWFVNWRLFVFSI